ncbi:MAG: hypothetical protein J6C55_00295 [Oscillospiraceae bacterium]|nr:hypothetical protein [Oscillospiraceae bacterium]
MIKQNTNKNIKNKILKFLQVPENIFSDISPIDFLSNQEVLIQDSKGILEYNDQNIKINIGNNIIANFKGRNLKIKSLSQKNLIITGFIISMNFLT